MYSLAQARTGTGKTLAFLIPLLQNIISVDPNLEQPARRSSLRGSSDDIRAIIISPTRELAEQIAVEAKKVTRGTGVIVQTAVGGSRKAEGLQRIKREGCHILVGTPGRLNDILSDPYSQVRAPNLSAFVLDEADRLLDQGFAPDIKAIQDLLPDRRERDRQTLLYSATVPREVMQIVRKTMKPDFEFVRTVQEGEQQTHEKVPQKIVNVGGFENLMPALVELCTRETPGESDSAESPAMPMKAIVYFGSTAEVSLAAAVLQTLQNSNRNGSQQQPFRLGRIIEIHSKLTQGQRTYAADSFRRAKSGILLSSDVTARGMDFPNVTHVIQIGSPPSQEQYVHRIGRTARGDKTGEGWMLATNLEYREIRRKLADMPLKPDETLETAKVDMKKDAQLPEHTAQILTAVQEATKQVPRGLKVGSYMACLGVYSYVSSKQKLIDALNDRATYGWGMQEPPKVGHGLAVKLGLNRLEGIVIGHEERELSDRGRPNSGQGRSFGDRERGGFGGRSFDRGSRDDRGGFGGRSFDRGSREDQGGYRGRSFDRSDREDLGGYGGRSFDRSDREDRSGSGGRSFDRGSRDNQSGFGGRSFDRGGFGGGGGRSSDFGRSDRPQRQYRGGGSAGRYSRSDS